MLQNDVVITMVPGFQTVSEKLTKFRWTMHVALPYPFPCKTCIGRDIVVADKPFTFEIHNHFDRVIQTFRAPDSGVPYFQASLVERQAPNPTPPNGCVAVTREQLKSVAYFGGHTDYASPGEAFEGTGTTVTACLDWLASFLAACQRDAPYLLSWLVYPVSLYDVGTVHHDVRAYCTTHNDWHLFACAVQTSLGSNLQKATFFIEPPTNLETTSPLDTTNELLAEALMGLYRGMPRQTVVTSYTALESLANVVYSKTRVAALIANSVQPEYSKSLVADELKRHRTDVNFLFHGGIKSASGRSLMDENQQQYAAVTKTYELRNRIAHAGYKPSKEEAREAHQLCCEVVQWLAGVGGLPVKPLVSAPADTSQGFTATIIGGCHTFVPQGAQTPPSPAAPPNN